VRSEVTVLLGAALAGCFERPIDYTAKSCTGACADGFSCEASICVPQGGRLCATLTGADTCLDFEDGTLPDAGLNVEKNGSLTVDAQRAHFGTSSMHSQVLGPSGATQRLEFPLPPDWKSVRSTFDLFPVLQPFSTAAGLSLGEVLCVPGTSFTGLWLFYAADSAGSSFVAKTDNDTKTTPLRPTIELDRWTRVSLEVERGTLSGSVRLDGVLAATQPINDCGGTWFVTVGMSSPNGVSGEAWYDDVVIDVER
jgi:hypothetical protein